MNGWIEFFYPFINGGALLLSALGIWFSVVVPGMDRWTKRFFRTYFIILMLCCLSAFLELLPFYFPVAGEAIRLVLFLECLLLSLPFIMLTVYLLHASGERMGKSRLIYIVLILWIAYIILVTASSVIDGFAYTTSDGRYYRGPWYPLILLPMTAVMLFTLIGAIKRSRQLSHKTFISLLTAILPMMAALVLQMIIEVFPVITISIVISALSMYSLILSDQIEQDLHHQRQIAKQQQEIANQRASIMVLQMRPHFIYNTMISIYSLCNQDPQRARQIVLDFTTYLRKNFTAITSSTPIPFSSELEHTRAYLAVEQAQYEDSLSVDYDMPHTLFRLPPLTLQPIVENAVKHGRDPYAGVFHISIRTKKTDEGSEIIISDNGRGFAPSRGGEAHIALKNIQQRLELMCGGSMTITPGKHGGTVVTVTIPDSAG